MNEKKKRYETRVMAIQVLTAIKSGELNLFVISFSQYILGFKHLKEKIKA